ncbi:septum formation initiator family protein [Acidiferrimicrobium sp. IK]|uniref:FtsB family cell division protein n=1 Tax=Acidiferrimicrobium sp. IK TaxID=2871700 RepID=UPI0021CB45E0|nr:septum formation initiator family protein [Acidiferrimicrobium sp. IK]MCU4187077.1 septum formation initiator family protein [Acidiferrimicrobium sp. IK]
MRRTVRILLLSVTGVAVIVLFVLPGRQLLDQGRQLSSTRRQINMLSQENAKLTKEAASLQTDATIEQLARQKYGLVMPGEQAYVVLPQATPAPGSAQSTPTTTVPPSNTP